MIEEPTMNNTFHIEDLAEIECRARQLQAATLASFVRGCGRGLRRMLVRRRGEAVA